MRKRYCLEVYGEIPSEVEIYLDDKELEAIKRLKGILDIIHDKSYLSYLPTIEFIDELEGTDCHGVKPSDYSHLSGRSTSGYRKRGDI